MIDARILADYFSGKKVSPFYGKDGVATTLYQALKIHSNGEVPSKLLDERRPNESVQVFEYRKKIFKSKTQGPFSRIVNTLAKIRRSPEWSIRYDAKAFPPQIAPNETLQAYCEENYPQYTSVTNWVFKVLLVNYLIDANGVVVVKPTTWEVGDTEYLKPQAFVYNSTQIVELTDDYCILKGHEVNVMLDGGAMRKGKSFWVITKDEFLLYTETANNKFIKSEEYTHGLGILPVFKMQGSVLESTPLYTLFTSRLAGIVPSFDEAAREYSDLQASMVAHIYPERWEYQTDEGCSKCYDSSLKRSTGFIKIAGKGNRADRWDICSDCGGKGDTKLGPYSTMSIRPAKTTLGETAAPIPPAGYIQKDVAVPTFQEKRIQTHIYDGLSAINMEHLAEVPLAESGLAKAVDRDDFNNFVHAIAEDIVYIMDKIYFLINEYRYRVIVPDYSRRKLMLPYISVPENFDLMIANNLVDEIKQAKEAGVSPTILAELQMGYASAKFYNNPAVRDELNCVFELDPLPGDTQEEKNSMKLNGGVSEMDYVISCNIEAFVRRAKKENDNFYSLDFAAKRTQMEKYAQEVIDSNMGADVDPNVDGGGQAIP